MPDHLWPNFRVLQQLADELKVRNASLRRNILFDDTNLDLKMDFSTDGINWKTVLPSEARKSLEKCRPSRTRRLSVSGDELNSMLGEASQENASSAEVSMEDTEEF